MKMLQEKILKEGKVIGDSILKVDGFLNHQIDPILVQEIGKEFKRRFGDEKITKVLTIEASGIAMAIFVALEFGVPLVFAKKYKPLTMENSYHTVVHSFTKKRDFDVVVSKDFIKENDVVLIIDDFLAQGGAMAGLIDIVGQAKAKVSGIGIVIEKGFQDGGKKLRGDGYKVESLAIIKGFENGKVIF